MKYKNNVFYNQLIPLSFNDFNDFLFPMKLWTLWAWYLYEFYLYLSDDIYYIFTISMGVASPGVLKTFEKYNVYPVLLFSVSVEAGFSLS